jgi:hypothetical protein
MLLPPIPGLTPRLGPALLPAPTAGRVVVEAGGLRAPNGAAVAVDLAPAPALVVVDAPSLLAPIPGLVAAAPLVAVEEASEEEADVGRDGPPTAEPRVALVFRVVGTKPPALLGPGPAPAVD